MIYVFTEEIVYAVLFGCVLVSVNFVCKYAQIPCIVGSPMRGGQLTSYEQRSPAQDVGIRYICDSWLLVVRLKGYIFFASVQKVTAHIRQVLREEQEYPGAESRGECNECLRPLE